jgi:hypothetical protein
MATENEKAPHLGIATEDVAHFLDRALSTLALMPATREKSLVITKIEEAQMWLIKGAKTCG